MVGYAMAGLFIVQGAPDLALTQVAIETLTTVLFVLVLRRLPDRFERQRAVGRRPCASPSPPPSGRSSSCSTLARRAIDRADRRLRRDDRAGRARGRRRNVVNVILVDFRGLDTLGEITVLAAAAIGTVALARAGGRRPRVTAPPSAPANVGDELVTRLVTIDVSVRIVFAAVMVGSLWLLFAGHNQPGGGFVGGIVAGAAVALRYVAGGIAEVRRLLRGQAVDVLGAGLLISAVTAASCRCCSAGPCSRARALTLDLPLLGSVKLTSALVFDIGVYLAVIGAGADGVRVVRRRTATSEPVVSVLMAFTAAVLFGIGTYLLLQRKLSRLIIGLGLIGHGANIVFVTTAGAAARRSSDPATAPTSPTRCRRRSC